MVSKSVIAKLKERLESRTGPFEFKPTLRSRLLFVIVSASLIIVLVSTLLSLRYQRQQLIESAQSSASSLNNAIEANLQHAMLTGDRGMIKEIVRAIVAEGAVESLRILDDQGFVHASSAESEEGFRFTQAEEICQACHVNSTSQRSNNVVFMADNRHEVLLNVNLIENKAQCHTCHNPENQVLGLMMTETSLSGVNEQLGTGFWRTILIAVTAFLLLIVLIVPALNRYIVRPINELSKGVAEISAGNLSYQVPVMTHDELGELAKSFDNMRLQLKITRAEMVRREQELAILNEVGLAATQLLDLQEILEIALDTMVGKLGMDNVLIYLWDEAKGRYTMQASRGISQAQIDEIKRRRQSGDDITQEVVETGKEVFVANMAEDPRFQGVWQNLEDRSYVKLPLMSRGTVVGVLGAVTPVGQSLTPHDVDFLKAIGREIGIAIDNATLLAETKQREKQAITLYRLGMNISASLSLNDVLDMVAEAARELMNADIGLVGLIDDEAQEVVVKAIAGAQRNLINNMLRMSVIKQAPWSELLTGQPYMTSGDD
ncbi:MAG: GAF domain-containing protein, partial [Anaerolineales bacterium]